MFFACLPSNYVGGKRRSVRVMSCSASLYARKDDTILAVEAKNGDNAALHILFSRYEPFIRAYAGAFGNAAVEIDDLMQEGRLGLASAVKFFDSGAGASFKTFAHICIKRQIISLVRKAQCRRNLPMSGYVSLDDVAKSEIPCSKTANPEDMAILKERISAVKTALRSMFTPFERRLFSLYLSGLSYNDIAKSLNVSQKRVDNSLQRIKRRLCLLFD